MRIAMLGDSITSGGTFWRRRMLALRADLTFVGNFGLDPYKHDGIAGDTTAGGTMRDQNVPECDVAMVLLGTNDGPSGIIYQQTWNNWISIVNALSLRATTAVAFCTLLGRTDNPVYNNYNLINNQWARDNLIGQVANPAKCKIIDTYIALATSGFSADDLLVDGLHPSWLGYEVLARYCVPRL